MMHQPVDYNDVRFYAAETLLIPNGKGRCAVLGAPCAARTGVGAPRAGAQGDHKGCAYTRDGQPTPPRRRAAPFSARSTRSRAGGHPAPRTGAKRP
jgi:hypothetical protein